MRWTVFKSQFCGFAAQKYSTKPQLKNCRLARRYAMDSDMEEHKSILEKLSNNDFPSEIDEQSFPQIAIFKELYDQGYIKALDVSSDDGDAFLNPKITLPGRKYLAELKSSIDTVSSIVNNTIHINAPFQGTLQSGEHNFIGSNPAENPNEFKLAEWVMDNIVGVVLSGLILSALLAWLGLGSNA